jgi:hypothetical protein
VPAQEQADRLLAVLRSLLTKNKATAGAMQQRVLDPLQAAISGLRTAVSGGTGKVGGCHQHSHPWGRGGFGLGVHHIS